jgi:hypothetical protein
LSHGLIGFLYVLSVTKLQGKRVSALDEGSIRMPLLSASVIVCETVLLEKTDVMSAIRIMNVLSIAEGNNFARFSSITFLNSTPGDDSRHILKVQMLKSTGELVAEGPEQPFVYGYKIDPSGAGGYNLTTNFNLDLRTIGPLGQYAIWAFLDGVRVGGAALMLRRAHG